MALPSLPHPLAAGRHEAVFEGWTCFVFFLLLLFHMLFFVYIETHGERQGEGEDDTEEKEEDMYTPLRLRRLGEVGEVAARKGREEEGRGGGGV
jgi:hypothetical protein